MDSFLDRIQLTFNNPLPVYSHEYIISLLDSLHPRYYSLSDEVGESGTPHTHVFIVLFQRVRFSHLKSLFPTAHIEQARGSNQENEDYIQKSGKWQNSDKSETSVPGTYYSFGNLPSYFIKKPSRADVVDLIRAGATDDEIIDAYPQFCFDIDKFSSIRETLRYSQYKNEWRSLSCYFVWGATGTGKTRSIMEHFGYSNVYRVTDYSHPFDSYRGEDIIIFEEFRSSLRCSDMLNYLDGYPLVLPSRYRNKQACFHSVFICTNESPSDQFLRVPKHTTDAFWRRFSGLVEFQGSFRFFYPDFQHYLDKNFTKDGTDLFEVIL